MPREKQKSVFNPCPICGLPRGKGPHEFSHVACAEQRAKTDGEQKAFPNAINGLQLLKVKDVENRIRKRRANNYKAGKLPSFMYD